MTFQQIGHVKGAPGALDACFDSGRLAVSFTSLPGAGDSDSRSGRWRCMRRRRSRGVRDRDFSSALDFLGLLALECSLSRLR